MRQKILWIWDRGGGKPKPDENSAGVSRTSVLQLEELAVQQFAIGKSCGVIISEDEKCYQVGRPGSAKLTLQGIESTLHEITILKTHQITKVACGYHHVAAVDRSGSTFCWGASQYGQCGTVKDLVAEPNRIALNGIGKQLCIIDVACGKKHTMAITEDHELWGWGASNMIGGVNATRRNVACSKPQIVEHLSGRRVFQVSCGKFHTSALTEKITKQSTIAQPDASPTCNLCNQELYKMQDSDDQVIITDAHICSHNSFISEMSDDCTSRALKLPLKRQTHGRSASLPFFQKNSPLSVKKERLSKTPPSISLISLSSKNNSSIENLSKVKPEDPTNNPAASFEMENLNSTSSTEILDLKLDPEAALSYLKHLSPEPSKGNSVFFPDAEILNTVDNEESATKFELDDKNIIGPARQTISERITQSITDNQLLSPLTSYSKNMLTGVIDGFEWIKTSTYDKGVAPIRDLLTKDKIQPTEDVKEKAEEKFAFTSDHVSDPLRSVENNFVGTRNEKNEFNTTDHENNLTLHTEVWTWGENSNGELGMADLLDRFHPVCVKTLSQRGVVKIKCGSHHTLALTSNSEVYSWGNNKYGQLGHNNPNTSSPMKIEYKDRIWDISAGRHHTLLLVDEISDEPNIIVCGFDEESNTGPIHPLKLNEKKNPNRWKLRPVECSHKMGFQCTVVAGFSTLSSCLAEKNCSSLIQALHSFSKSEREFYQQIMLIKTDILHPLKFTELYKHLENSTYSDIISKIFELFGTLAYNLGLNTVHLTRAITSGNDCQKNTFNYVGNDSMQSYEKYFNSLNDAIAFGFFEKCEQLNVKQIKSKFLSLPKIVKIFKELLGDKRFSKLPSENFLQILQLPAFRIHEYAKLLNKVSIASDEDHDLSSFLQSLSNRWEELWTKINNQLQSANNTRGFWKNDFKFGAGGKLAESLKKVGRYLVIHSKKIPLDIAHTGRFSMNWFILFNDCLVLVHYGTHFIHPLNLLWCSSITDPKQKGHLIKIVTPEEEIIAIAGNEEAKSTWVNSFNRTINHAISRNDGDRDASQHYLAPSSARHASHTFTKNNELKGVTFTGAWYNGKPHGKGEMCWPDGRTYKGQYKNGKENGYGEWRNAPGAISKLKYQGYWKEGKMEGYGKLWYNKYQTYEGSFIAGMRDGHGVLRTGSVTEGSVYVGAWKKDHRCGFGVEDNITKGEKYLGMWMNDERHGIGILVTLDGLYGQSRFSHGVMAGDTLLIEGRYTFEGHLTAGLILNGKGRLTLPTGDKLEGSFSGPWGDNIRVSGNLIRLDLSHSNSTRPTSPGTPIDITPSFNNFAHKDHTKSILRRYNRHIMRKHVENKHIRSFPLSLHPDLKWTEIFSQCQTALGCLIKDDEKVPETRKVWDSVSIAMANSKRKRKEFNQPRLSPQKKADETKLHWLEKVPSVVTEGNSNLTKDDVNCIREYLAQAFSTTLHPLGELVESLGNVFRDSYSGTGAHKWLLTQAVADVRSFVRRSYDILQYMFPMLDKDHGISHMKIVDIHDGESNSEDLTNNIDYVTAGDLLLPVLLPRVYPTLFTLYALKNENEDKSYWERVTRLNRHPDVALLSFLGVKPKFWLLDEKEIPPLELSPEDGQLYDTVEQAESSKWRHLLVAQAQDCSFLSAVETLQLISTTFIPAEKLNVIYSTFKAINATVLTHHKQTHTWSMDDLFPVFQYVVIRSRISHLGCEIQLIEDFLEPDMCKGEKGIMFTTLKACYFQIRVEKDL
ncbi:alsin-like isoform X2 [Styela clava]